MLSDSNILCLSVIFLINSDSVKPERTHLWLHIRVRFHGEAWGGGEGGGVAGQQSSQDTTFISKVCCLMWVWFVATQNNYSSNIEEYWLKPNNQCNSNNGKAWNTARITSTVNKCCWRTVLLDLLYTELPQTFSL